tara:strand:+ start:708 stop:1280 length:573 start_codon:yes stop_codon:yes gene_type:complete
MKKNSNFIKYRSRLVKSLDNIDTAKLSKVIKLFKNKIKNKNKIFVCGNGGSAAISNHYICDFLKLVRQKTNFKPRFLSLANNLETITAISNDINYDKIFSYQLESLFDPGDILILISSSGNSKNMVNALKFAKKNQIYTISFTGFKGGYLRRNSDLSIHVQSNAYSISEDTHHILMHYLMEELIYQLNIK